MRCATSSATLRREQRSRPSLHGIVALALLLSGCATHVPQVLTAPILPKAFSGEVQVSDQVWPQPYWWRSFADPELSSLFETAQLENRDLAVPVARVMEAQAQKTIQLAALFPQISAEAQAVRSPSSESGQAINGQSYSAGDSFGLTFGPTYELDFWGLARSNLRAANEREFIARWWPFKVRGIFDETVPAGPSPRKSEQAILMSTVDRWSSP